jgi:hypothetical protein
MQGTKDFVGIPNTYVKLSDIMDKGNDVGLGSILRQAYNLERYNIQQGLEQFNPQSYAGLFDGKQRWQENLRKAERAKAIELGQQSSKYAEELGNAVKADDFRAGFLGGGTKRAEMEVAERLGRESDQFAGVLDDIAKNTANYAPSAVGNATYVGGKLLGKGLQVAGAAAPFILPAVQVSQGINPGEAAVRGALDWAGSAIGMSAGGTLGAATAPVTGPVGAVAGGIGGSMVGSVAADWVADRIFGDEAPRMAEYAQKKAQEKQQAQQIDQSRLSQADAVRQGIQNNPQARRYLAERYLASPWTTSSSAGGQEFLGTQMYI